MIEPPSGGAAFAQRLTLGQAPFSRERRPYQLDCLCKALEPWSSDSWYFNFADRPTDLEAIFAPNTLVRLREVKREYDPDGLIAGNHNISLA